MFNSTARTEPKKDFQHKPKDDNLPLAIGANFHDDPLNRNTLRKSHNLTLNPKSDHNPHTQYNYTGFQGEYSRSKAGADLDDEPDVWNGWLSEELTEEEKREFVVRMAGFFEEKVPESSTEKERVRKVCINFYTQDNSISIIEPKEANSGIVQSKILSRRQVPKVTTNPNDIFTLDDFHVGECVKIFGVNYTIVDMDARSRKYFREIRGEEVAPPISTPEDNFATTRKKELQKSNTRAVTSDDMDLRRAAEQQLTGVYTKHSNEDIKIAEQFLKNRINEHLSYLAIWDDRNKLSGDLHKCVIRLYLENFSVEIVEVPQPNSGRSGGPILVSKQRIPKPDANIDESRYQQHTYGKLMKNNFLSPEDFEIGETLMIFGNPYFIYDCDAFTRNYVKENFDISMKPAVDIKPFTEGEKKPILFYPPPPNGFGSETEKRDNWLKLEGKTARIDQEKMQRETGRVMKFLAKLAKPLSKDDENREFLVAFFRETDEVEITEKAVRNSGYLGGRFLVKGKHRKELPNGSSVPFQPSDFVVGQEVTIFKRPFILLKMDDETKSIVDGSDKIVTEDRIKYLVLLMKQQISLKFKRAHDAYGSLAPHGTLGYKQVQEFLRSCSCIVSDDEAVLVVQNLAPNSNGVITYDQFLNIMNAGTENMDEASLSARTVKNVNMKTDASMKGTANMHATGLRRRQMKEMLQHKLIQRKGTVQEQFRLLSEHSANSRLNRDVFRRSLNEVMHFNVSKEDEDVLVSMLFDGVEDENGDITFKQFQDFIDS